VAPTEEPHAHALDGLRIDVAIDLAPIGIARHEQLADRVFARLGQLEAELVGDLDEELVWDLYQDAGAVAGARIGTDRAAVLKIAKNRQCIVDDLVRTAALDVGNEADAVRILVERRIVKALRLWQPDARTVDSQRAHRPKPSFPALASAPAPIASTPRRPVCVPCLADSARITRLP